LSASEAARVYLVGAGPGDPGLLTMRALELIALADVILYDRLIPAEALEGARADAELLFVGKEGGGQSVPQEQTEALMVQRARRGSTVVRLKGGDPFVFGRGGEEALALLAADIPFEVVPGVTAGVAAAAYAGIPVTHRGLSTAVAFITGHTRADSGGPGAAPQVVGEMAQAVDPKGGRQRARETTELGAHEVKMPHAEAREAEVPNADAPQAGTSHADVPNADAPEAQTPDGGDAEDVLDWPALAAFPGTLVFYMGVRQLPRIAASLIDAGRPAREPAAVVERGTLPAQRTITGTLATIAERAQSEGVRAPAITVVGAVTELAERLAWRAPAPLSGRTVAVTRARAQASPLARRLRELGAEVVQAPAIRIRPLPDAAPRPFRAEARQPATGAPAASCEPDAPAPLDLSPYDLATGAPAASREPGAPAPLDLSPYDLVCLTSPNGVACLFERIAAAGIGPGTARALAEQGILADVVPERFVAESLVQALAALPVRRALIARAQEARDVLPDALRARGAEVDVLELYETVAEPLAPRVLAAARAAVYITCTSSSTVRFFLDAAGGDAGLSPQTRIVSIGPVTSATLREHGLEPHVEAAHHDVDGLVQALISDATKRGG
jgi:uroporphyrinogen III methyltransferase/synthase